MELVRKRYWTTCAPADLPKPNKNYFKIYQNISFTYAHIHILDSNQNSYLHLTYCYSFDTAYFVKHT